MESFNEAYDGKYFADIEFVPRNDSGGGYSDKVNASVMAGGLPDVLTVDGPNVAAYASNGIIQPLAELTEEERSEYLPSIIEQGTVNGDLYALGVMESSVGFYYNREIIEEAGIDIPDADDPWTWSEFLDILAELKPIMEEKNGYPLDMTFPVGETSIYYYAPFVWSGGGELVSEDGLTVEGYFDSEQTARAMEFFRTVVEKEYMSEAPIDHLFESGRAAFKFDGAWEVNTVYTSYPDIELGVAPYIVSDDWDGEAYTPTGSWAFAASSEAEDIEGATELVNILLLTEETVGRLNGHQGEMVLGIRGEDIRLRNQASDTDGMDLLHAVITDTEVMGNENNLFFNFGGNQTVARVSKDELRQVGDRIDFVFLPSKMHFFDKTTGINYTEAV